MLKNETLGQSITNALGYFYSFKIPSLDFFDLLLFALYRVYKIETENKTTLNGTMKNSVIL